MDNTSTAPSWQPISGQLNRACLNTGLLKSVLENRETHPPFDIRELCFTNYVDQLCWTSVEITQKPNTAWTAVKIAAGVGLLIRR
jgi:hypothetical protein